MKGYENSFLRSLKLYEDYDSCNDDDTSLLSGMAEVIQREEWLQSRGIPSIPEEKRPGTRARYLDNLVRDVVTGGQLLLTETGRPFVYCDQLGCYRPLGKLQKYLYNFFSKETAASIPVREYRDICERLTWQAEIECRTDEFNPYTDYVNLTNGVLNLVTGELEDHSKDFRFNYQINAEYLKDWEPGSEEDSSCESFNSFCRSSLENDPDKRKLLLEFIGYICTDKTEGKCAIFFKGLPNSGKSVVSAFIARLFDPGLVSNVPLHQLADRFFRAEFAGKKLNVAGETAGKPLRDISIFKSITGGDHITGEFKGGDPFTFTPRCKLLFAGNTLPLTTDVDATAAFTNRIRVLLFNASIEQENQDRDLAEKLWAERNYIVTLALRTVKQLIQRNYEFTEPKDSKEFLKSFAMRGNVLGAFLKECCVLAPGERVHNRELYAAFMQFCDRNGIESIGRNKFYDLLSGIPFVFMRRVRINDKNRQGHLGIRLKDEFCSGTLEQKP